MSDKVLSISICIFNNHLSVEDDIRHEHEQSSVELNLVKASRQGATHDEVEKSGKASHSVRDTQRTRGEEATLRRTAGSDVEENNKK